jgi:hypothetical protein
MKKIKTTLVLLSALILLLTAACQQGLSPTSPDLGDYNDSRTNQNYTDNGIRGIGYFPSINPVNGLLGGRTNPADTDTLVEIDFTAAVSSANDAEQTLDILKGDVAANIRKAIFFEGVRYTFDPLGTNTYSPLSYNITAVDREIVYVRLPDLAGYHQVRPYIKALEYRISGQPIDTDGNLKGGETPYDDHYYPPRDISDGADPTGVIDRPTQKKPFSLGSFTPQYETSVCIYGAAYDGIGEDTASYVGLSSYIKLEQWKPGSKAWEATGIGGQYTAYDTGTIAGGTYYFNIPFGQNSYDKYRIVAVDLYKFETGVVQGFKRRFSVYPGTSDPVTIKDGKKVLDVFVVQGSDYERTHTTGGAIFDSASVYTNEVGEEALLILDVDTSQGGPVGNRGLESLPGIERFNGSFKLAYQLSGSDSTAVYEYIGITKAELREKPGTAENFYTGEIQQQLVLTLDPAYTWVENRDVYILAKDGIKFAGDDARVADRKPNGFLGDANGTININGDYTWGVYGIISLNAGQSGVPVTDPPDIGGGGENSLPSAPTGLSGTYNEGSVQLYWNPVSGASSYRVYRSTSQSGGTYIDTTSNPYYSDSGLPVGTYYYRVAAVSSSGSEGPRTGPVSVTVPGSGGNSLPAPTGLIGEYGGGSVQLYWDQVPGALSYNVYRDNQYTGNTYDSYYSESGLSVGTYYYRVAAVSSSGSEGSRTDSVSVTVPGGGDDFPPSSYMSLTPGQWTGGSLSAGQAVWYAFTAAGGSYDISWDDSYEGSGSYSCDIKVSAYDNSGNTFFSGIDSAYSTPRQITGYSGLIYLKVQGYSSSSTGTYAIRYSQTGGGDSLPAAPTGLYGYYEGGSVQLYWDQVSGASYYRVYRNSQYIDDTYNPYYSDSGLSAGTYYYEVAAVSSIGEGPRAGTTVLVSGGGGGDLTISGLPSGEYFVYALTGNPSTYTEFSQMVDSNSGMGGIDDTTFEWMLIPPNGTYTIILVNTDEGTLQKATGVNISNGAGSVAYNAFGPLPMY